VLNGVAQVCDVGFGGVALVDESEGVARGDSGVTHAEAFRETGLLKEPCRREFDEAISGWPVRNGVCRDVQSRGDFDEDGFRDDGIFEEGTGAAAVVFALYDKHPFTMTNFSHSVVNLDGRRALTCKVARKIRVSQFGFCRCIEAKGHSRDDVTITVRGVEDASAVRKSRLFAIEIDKGICCQIEGADIDDGVRHFLTVGTDVLNGRAADGTRDACKTLDTADSLLANLKDERVPVRSGGDDVVDEVAVELRLYRSLDGDVKDQAIETGVADEQIAAATKDEDRQVVLASVFDGFDEGGFSGDFAEEAGGAADAEGGVGSQEHGLLDSDRETLHGFEGTTPAVWEVGHVMLNLGRQVESSGPGVWNGGAVRCKPVQSYETSL
jgi:hypothetical protein